MASTSACHAPTPPPRTIRLSASSVPLTTLCAAFCSRLPFRHPTESKPCRQPLTFLTFCPPKRYNLGRRTLPFSALHPPMITSAYLVANVTLTCLPPLPIGCPLGLPYVSSWTTPLITKDTAAFISLPTVTISRHVFDESALCRALFPSLTGRI